MKMSVVEIGPCLFFPEVRGGGVTAAGQAGTKEKKEEEEESEV